uniref:Heme/steroid binding domaincontaining protein putati n=1 Tax=Albugo laibachii Nc14 TaxID=890382 RepID=F0WXC1_9STRA|nr:heme/steroid binding domaincontaining protein putati [Albugo laibachii Nc14]|eukprot:CCA26113.1 heme/steroid binding domaincontaining protein putati [Albugo laibachii Nc14]
MQDGICIHFSEWMKDRLSQSGKSIHVINQSNKLALVKKGFIAMEWFTGYNNVIMGTLIAVTVIVIVKIVNKSADAAHERAVARVKERLAAEEAKRKVKEDGIKRRYYTNEELLVFNGVDGKPIYVCLLDEVYDVTERAEYYGPDGNYHIFAGRDASRALATMSFDQVEIENDVLEDLRSSSLQTLQEWVTKFKVHKKYPVVGRLLRHKNLTKEELKKFNGTDNIRKTIYVAICGKIYDVTMDGGTFYGPEGSYKAFAGNDASRALALMSFDQKNLTNTSLDDLTDTQKKTLKDWVIKFEKKYPVVGDLVDE